MVHTCEEGRVIQHRILGVLLLTFCSFGMNVANAADSHVVVIAIASTGDVARRVFEFDCAVVVEPAQIVREGPHGERALYVALTRSTDRLVIVHDRPLPDAIDRPGSDRFRAADLRPIEAKPSK